MKNAVLVSLVANAAALSTENDEPNLKVASGFKHAETTIQLEQMAHLAHSAEGAKNEGLFAKIKTFFNENVFMTEEFEKFNFTSQDLRVLAAREEKAEKEALAAKKDGVEKKFKQKVDKTIKFASKVMIFLHILSKIVFCFKIQNFKFRFRFPCVCKPPAPARSMRMMRFFSVL